MYWYRIKGCRKMYDVQVYCIGLRSVRRLKYVIVYWCKIKECRKTVRSTSLALRSVGRQKDVQV